MVSSDYYIADNSDMEAKKLEAAKNHYKTGDYAAAIKLYMSLINTNISYKLYHRIGKCYYKMGDINQAEEYFKKSIGLEKFSNPSYYYLGNILYKKEDIKGAIYNWACALVNKPNDENLCLNLATSYFSCGMKFQSVFYYEKYLKNASSKGESYSAIKESLDKCSKVGNEFMQKAKMAVSRMDYKSAIEFLNFAVKNQPTSFDINHFLGSAYLKENDNMHALIYLKQAYCLDNKSLDVLQKLTSAYINLGDYIGAYASMRRLLPLVIHNQGEYLKTMKLIKELGSSFDDKSYIGAKEWGDKYFSENNFHFALIEYENCLMLNPKMQNELEERMSLLHLLVNGSSNTLNFAGGKISQKEFGTVNV